MVDGYFNLFDVSFLHGRRVDRGIKLYIGVVGTVVWTGHISAERERVC